MLHRLNGLYGKFMLVSCLIVTMLGYLSINRAYAYDLAAYENSVSNPVYSAEQQLYSYSTNTAVEPEAEEVEQVQIQQPPEVNIPKPLVYQINSGDTLYQIAKTFDVDLADLTAMNGIQDPRSLRIGQQLQIPGKVIDVDLPSGSSHVVSRVLMSTLTAYTAGVESTGKRPTDPGYGTTYSGSSAQEGRTIAVDPGVIPLGATVFIDGVGVRKAEDIGSAIRGARIDVFMNDLGQAREFGVKKNVIVYVLS